MSAIPSINGLKARVAFRMQIQEGKLPVPVELGEFSEVETALWKALWKAYLNNEEQYQHHIGLTDSTTHVHSISLLNVHQTQVGFTHLLYQADIGQKCL